MNGGLGNLILGFKIANDFEEIVDEQYAELAVANESLRAEIETLRRQFAIAKHQWKEEEATRLNARLQKYEPGSPMLLNSAVPNVQGKGLAH